MRCPTLCVQVVFMGQGEPLYNWRNVSAAVDVMTDRLMGRIAPVREFMCCEPGCGVTLPSPRSVQKRLTVSTSGVSPKMEDVGRYVEWWLASIVLRLTLYVPVCACSLPVSLSVSLPCSCTVLPWPLQCPRC